MPESAPANPHPAASLFAGRVADYAAARPSYPRAAIDLVVRDLPAQTQAIDLGCGTGISTRALAGRGLAVIGVDPNTEMLAAAAAAIAADAGTIEYRLGDESLASVAAASVDLVACFQSFHWLDPATARRSFARVLKPGGRVALVWNLRVLGDPAGDDYAEAVGVAPAEARYGIEAPDGPLFEEDPPAFRAIARERFANPQSLDEAGLVARARSASYFPRDALLANKVERDLRTLFSRHAQPSSDGPRLRLGQETLVVIAEVAR